MPLHPAWDWAPEFLNKFNLQDYITSIQGLLISFFQQESDNLFKVPKAEREKIKEVIDSDLRSVFAHNHKKEVEGLPSISYLKPYGLELLHYAINLLNDIKELNTCIFVITYYANQLKHHKDPSTFLNTLIQQLSQLEHIENKFINAFVNSQDVSFMDSVIKVFGGRLNKLENSIWVAHQHMKDRHKEKRKKHPVPTFFKRKWAKLSALTRFWRFNIESIMPEINDMLKRGDVPSADPIAWRRRGSCGDIVDVIPQPEDKQTTNPTPPLEQAQGEGGNVAAGMEQRGLSGLKRKGNPPVYQEELLMYLARYPAGEEGDHHPDIEPHMSAIRKEYKAQYATVFINKEGQQESEESALDANV